MGGEGGLTHVPEGTRVPAITPGYDRRIPDTGVSSSSFPMIRPVTCRGDGNLNHWVGAAATALLRQHFPPARPPTAPPSHLVSQRRMLVIPLFRLGARGRRGVKRVAWSSAPFLTSEPLGRTGQRRLRAPSLKGGAEARRKFPRKPASGHAHHGDPASTHQHGSSTNMINAQDRPEYVMYWKQVTNRCFCLLKSLNKK